MRKSFVPIVVLMLGVLLGVGTIYAQVGNTVTAGLNAAATDAVDGYDVVAPPPPPSNYLYEYFLLDPGSPLPNYSTDIKKDESSLMTMAKVWNLHATADAAGSKTLNLAFSSIGSYKAVLYDMTSGAYKDVTADPHYTYSSAAGTRYFRLLIGDRTAPTVAVTYPGAQLAVGTPVTISWTSTDATGILSQDVYYSLDGSTYTAIATDLDPSATSIGWTPSAGSSTATIKVVARDSSLNSGQNITGNFNIGYTITASAGSNGSISPPGTTVVSYDGSQSYTISPATGYHVQDVLVDGGSVGAVTSHTFSNVTAHHTISASFAINQYTVTFTANGGTGSMSPQTADYNTTAPLTSNAYSNTGHTFSGWNTAANGSGTAYADGADYTFTASITLYAQWTVNSYSVSFDANGGTGTMGSQSGNYNTSVTLTSNAFTRTGYTFTGWNTVANGSGTAYVNNASYTFPASDVILYAQWTVNSYSVSFDANGGTGTMGSQSGNYNTSVTLTSNAFTRTGYTFTGWNTAANGSGTAYANNASYTFPASDVTLYAQWSILQFTLTYTAGSNGSISGTSPQTVSYGGNGTAVSAVANTWYHFVKWSDDVTDNPRTDLNVTASINVSAIFAIDVLTVHRDAIAGWNLVSVPVPQATMTPTAVFGDDYGATPYYTFQYSVADGYTIPEGLAMGQGYWLGSNSAQTVDAVGSPLTDLILPLSNGFNIIGNPFVTDEPVSTVSFTDGSTSKTLSEASGAGWLSPVLYKYDGATYAVENTSLAVWHGYWIPMLRTGISVQYTAVIGEPAPKQSAPAPDPMDAKHWSVDLAATFASSDGITYADRVASFGVRNDATSGFDNQYDAPRPPRSPSGKFVEVGFAVSGDSYPKILGTSYARDFRAPEKAAWEFMVSASGEGKVTLSWDQNAVGSLGTKVNPVMYDVTARKLIDMKKVGTYAFDQDGTGRKFTVKNAGDGIPSSFQLAQNYPNPFNPSTIIRLGVPQDAVVSLDVYNTLGQKVAALLDGVSVEAGYHEVSFDAAHLASGLYLYRMSATGTNGKHFAETKKMLLMK